MKLTRTVPLARKSAVQALRQIGAKIESGGPSSELDISDSRKAAKADIKKDGPIH